jgi:hypothetical protein
LEIRSTGKAPANPETHIAPVIDIMEALKKSLAECLYILIFAGDCADLICGGGAPDNGAD